MIYNAEYDTDLQKPNGYKEHMGRSESDYPQAFNSAAVGFITHRDGMVLKALSEHSTGIKVTFSRYTRTNMDLGFEDVAYFSSAGPFGPDNYDLRIKPDIIAPGDEIESAARTTTQGRRLNQVELRWHAQLRLAEQRSCKNILKRILSRWISWFRRESCTVWFTFESYRDQRGTERQ